MRAASLALIVGVLLVLLSTGAMGLGLGSEYMQNDTLYLPQGGGYTYTLTLQNPDTSDVWVLVGAEEPNGIVHVVNEQESYKLPAGTYDNTVQIRIDIPDDAKIGREYYVGYYMQALSGAGDDGGMGVPFGVRFEKSIKVHVDRPVDQKETLGEWLSRVYPVKYRLLTAGVLIALIVLFSVLKKRKR